MKTSQVYDLPTRLFHWSFASVFLGAFLIAKTVDDESAAFSYHMLLGIVLCFLIALRIVWGFVGSSYSRFLSFPLNPKELLIYFRDLLTSKTKRYPGYNPASSWAALTMLALGLGLGVTGYMMTQGSQKDFYEDLHELLSNGFVVVVALHLLGILIHSLRHRENIALSMITGKRAVTDQSLAIRSSRPVAAFAFVFLVGAFTFYLLKNYDSNTQTLTGFGEPITLGETEGLENGQNNGNEDDED